MALNGEYQHQILHTMHAPMTNPLGRDDSRMIFRKRCRVVRLKTSKVPGLEKVVHLLEQLIETAGSLARWEKEVI